MKVLVQWTLADPTDWVEFDVQASGSAARRWRDLVKKQLPTGNDVIDDNPGWIFSLNVQGIQFSGYDHYAVEPMINKGALIGLRVYLWNDDPEDFPPGTRFGGVWELRDPEPDPRFGGQMNTRQKLTIYAEAPADWQGRETSDGPVEVLPWSQFPTPPAALTRHGVWVSNDLANQHVAARRDHHWTEWVTP